MISQEKRLETETEQHTKEGWGVCVECLMGKQNKPTLFKVTEPSSGLRHWREHYRPRQLGPICCICVTVRRP